MSCADKVPWMDEKPYPIINLDDPSQMFRYKISLREGESKGDYYMCFKNHLWVVIERKDQPARVEKAINYNYYQFRIIFPFYILRAAIKKYSLYNRYK
jgi:hypothetical protein